MIGKLKGRIEEIGEDHALLDVGGVGYLIFCSERTLRALPGPGEAAALVIETHVREDHIHLYGFADPAERDWFRALLTVQRVGAKMALAILGLLSPAQLAQAVLARDTAAISRVSGVGPKLAERIVAELRDKAVTLPAGNISGLDKTKQTGATPPHDDAIAALVQLGYSRSDAYAAAAAAARKAGSKAPVDQLVKLSLKELVS